jgi:hypothetical protein
LYFHNIIINDNNITTSNKLIAPDVVGEYGFIALLSWSMIWKGGGTETEINNKVKDIDIIFDVVLSVITLFHVFPCSFYSHPPSDVPEFWIC